MISEQYSTMNTIIQRTIIKSIREGKRVMKHIQIISKEKRMPIAAKNPHIIIVHISQNMHRHIHIHINKRIKLYTQNHNNNNS